MAPLKPARKEKDRKAMALLEFATDLVNRLNSEPVHAALLTDISTHINRSFPTQHQKSDYLSSKATEFDHVGSKLWNIATRLGREDAADHPPRIICSLRVFAFLLLDFAHQHSPLRGRQSGDNLVRVLRTALKAGRTCINATDPDLCTRVFERVADYVDVLNGEGNTRVSGWERSDSDGAEVASELIAEYYLLRAMLAWKQDRLEVAEHMYSKASAVEVTTDRTKYLEMQADLLYEIGKDMLRRKKYAEAIHWLERSYGALDESEREVLGADSVELRLCVLHDLVRALLGLGGEPSIARASDLISLLEVDAMNKMAVSMLRLSVISAQEQVPADEFQSVLLRMIRSVILTESTFKTIMNQIQKLKKFNHRLACQTLEDFLSGRLSEARNQVWTEKAVITYVWIEASHDQSLEQLDRLGELLDEVLQSAGQAFGPEATHAAQTLMWKRIDSGNVSTNGEVAAHWCRLASHALFGKAGELNRSKVARKMILLSLANGDFAAAREAYFQMPASGKAAPITLYLLYKVALRTGDAEMASECLDGVLKSSSKDATFLYACVLEAQAFGDKQQAVVALQKVLGKYNYGAPKEIYLPALLRITARLLVSELDETGTNTDAVMTEVCKLFEGAATQAVRFWNASAGTADERYTRELQWFAKNSYNIALKHCITMHPDMLLRMLTVCIHFIERLQKEGSSPVARDATARLPFCHYLAASASIVLGRSEDNIETSLQRYLHVRKHVEAYRVAMDERLALEDISAEARSDLEAKYFELLKYDLEAVLKLQRWDDLDEALESCLKQQNVEHWDTLADLVIVIHTHILKAKLDSSYQAKIPAVMTKIINHTWRSGSKKDTAKLSRWVRCVFQMSLNSDPGVSLQCIEQAISVAKKARGSSELERYPTDELEWLATTSFNHAIDLYCAGDEAGCRQWAERALNLAIVNEDEGHLHGTLQQKWLLLNVAEA